jgi:hypothetical protein
VSYAVPVSWGFHRPVILRIGCVGLTTLEAGINIGTSRGTQFIDWPFCARGGWSFGGGCRWGVVRGGFGVVRSLGAGFLDSCFGGGGLLVFSIFLHRNWLILACFAIVLVFWGCFWARLVLGGLIRGSYGRVGLFRGICSRRSCRRRTLCHFSKHSIALNFSIPWIFFLPTQLYCS